MDGSNNLACGELLCCALTAHPGWGL